MKNLLLKVLKISLIALGVLLVIALVFGIVLALDWPLWVGFFLLLIVAGLVIGGFFLKRLWLRQQEKKFVQKVIEQDEAHIQTLSGKERDELKEMQSRWQTAIETLRQSHLKKYGNPLYVLPWYMVIGESGSGKTTALNSARLSSPFAEMNRSSGISGTRNCEWWFFEQAIVIDTAGRYAIPVDEGKDKEEWQSFLTLLSRYRKKEPLNGLIVTIAADKLIGSVPEVLIEEGRNIRRRVDEVMRVLGSKFPVYILITKLDLIQGMSQFCEHLPENALEQPMGVINQDLSTDVGFFLNHAIDVIGERLRNLRILLLHKIESRTVDPGFLLFPEEFENLKQGLQSFMKGAFQENPYQETPILRGLFFSSGRQEGSPFSHFLNALGLIGEQEVLAGTSKGLFLHDFFAKILPKDRGLFAPTKRSVEWSSLTRNLGLISWVVIAVALCGLLSFSFVKNLRIIREVSHEFRKPPALQGNLLSDLITMDHYQQAILNMEKQNRNWWIPRFGLNDSIKVESALKENYCTQFQEGFLAPFDKQMALVIEQMTPATSDEVIGEYIIHLVRRINLLKARLEGRDLDMLQTRPQPFYITLASSSAQAEPEIRKKFGSLYLYYLVWRTDTGELSNQVETLQSWLKHILSLKRTNLEWLPAWIDREGSLPSITLADFWGGTLAATGERVIPPSYTRKGYEMIATFIKEFESALPDPVLLSVSKSEFEKRYRDVCFSTWQDFAENFSKGVERLSGMKEQQQVAAKMTTDQGPYFSFMNTAAKELEPLYVGGGGPSWLQDIYQMELIRTQLTGSSVPKVKEAEKNFLSKIEKIFSKKTGGGPVQAGSVTSSLKAYQDYQNALSAISPGVSSKNQAYQIALQTFSEDPAVSKSPFYLANQSLSDLRTSMAKGKPDEEIFWKLLQGPIIYLWAYTRMEAACYLQSQWEEKVLSETQGATEQEAIELLSSQEGPAWKFVKGPAAAFIGWNLQRGYYAKEVIGGAIPFEPSFFAFLSRGARSHTPVVGKQNYNVSIKGLPTDVNPDARIKPHSTTLELQCTGNNFSLVNQNYPVSKVFSWAPETCNDVIFQIEVGDLVLTRKYTGPGAFPEFLKDFKGGRRIFYPDDFPDEKGALERLRIKYIRVNYQFSGDQQVIGQARSLPAEMPAHIAQCWE